MERTKHVLSESSTIHRKKLDCGFTITSNATAADSRISWAAKGLLWYMLTRPDDWSIHYWQLASIYKGELKGGGRDAIRSILAELKDAGYVTYSKSRDVRGRWHHRYDVYPIAQEKEAEKPHIYENTPHIQYEPEPDHPGLENPAPEKACINKEQRLLSTEKKQQQPAAAAAVFFEKKEKPKALIEKAENAMTHFVYEFLDEIDIPDDQKQWLSSKYSYDVVKRAVEALTQPGFTPTKSKAAYLKWACKNAIGPDPKKEDVVEQNKALVTKFDCKINKSKTVKIEVLTKAIEFVFVTCQKSPDVLPYESSDFEVKFNAYMFKNGFYD